MANVITNFLRQVRRRLTGQNIPLITETINEMRTEQALWKRIYQNKSPWLTKNVKSLNLAATIAAEVSRLVTLDIKSSVNDEEINKIYQREIMRGLRNQVEYGLALGGFVMKPYAANGVIRVDFAQPADYQIVSAASDGTILEIFFKDFTQQKNNYYIRIEYHKFDELNSRYFISNRVFRSDEKGTIGTEITDFSNIDAWANIEPEFELQNIKMPLFGYFKPAVSNNIDTKSSQGISVFARAIDAIKRADIQLSGLMREFRVKEAKQYVSSTALPGGKKAAPLPYLEYDYYIKLDMADKTGSDKFFESYSPELYSQQFLDVLDEYKRQIEDCIGMSHGTISSPDRVARTATEIQVSKDRTAILVSENQNNLQECFENAIYALSVWKNWPNRPPELTVTTEWDDSTWVNWESQLTGMREDVASGLIKGVLYVMKKYGVDEATALEMMPDSAELLK